MLYIIIVRVSKECLSEITETVVSSAPSCVVRTHRTTLNAFEEHKVTTWQFEHDVLEYSLQ